MLSCSLILVLLAAIINMFVNQSHGLISIPHGNKELITRTKHNFKMVQNLRRSGQKKIKRYRSAFTTEQVNYLEEKFKKFPYIPNSQRKEAAVALNIPERAVKIWFQNRRMKEKRENCSKEFGEDVNEHTSIELAKDQLKNVMIPSTNDQQPQSLPILTDNDNVSSNKNVLANYSAFDSNTRKNAIPDKKVKEDFAEVNVKRSPPTFVTPYLSKKYKMGAFKQSNATGVVCDIKDIDIKQDIENKSIPNQKNLEQIIPEDLSGHKVTASTTTSLPAPNVAITNAGYVNQSMLPSVSPYYAEPYYSANGVFWKPVSVLPSVTTNGASVSVHIPNNLPNMPIVQQNVSKKCCKCDCHVEPLLSYNFQQQSPGPQYIITALPFPNPNPTKL